MLRQEADKLDKAIGIVNKILEIICVIIFAFITVIGTYQIVTRYVFNAPSTVSEELLTYSFTWLALLSAALVFGKREHLAMTFLSSKFKGSTAVIFAVITEILTLVFAAIVFIYGGISITNLTRTQVTASLGIKMSLVYMIVPICGFIIAFYNISNIYRILRDREVK